MPMILTDRSSPSAWECLTGRSASPRTRRNTCVNRPNGTQSVPGCMPTQSVGTITNLHTDRSSRSAWECLSGRSASPRTHRTICVNRPNGTQSVPGRMPTQSVGTIISHHTDRPSRSAWECLSGRSASPRTHRTLCVNRPNGTQSVPGCIPTQSVGTITNLHTDRSSRSAWECLSGRSASRRTHRTLCVNRPNGTQSVPGCMPTQSVGTIISHHTDRYSRSAWECLSGRSASPRTHRTICVNRPSGTQSVPGCMPTQSGVQP